MVEAAWAFVHSMRQSRNTSTRVCKRDAAELCVRQQGRRLTGALLRSQLAWRLGCLGAFLLARALLPRMACRSAKGAKATFVLSGASASVRGERGHVAHSAAMGGRRLLAQSLQHEFGPRGVQARAGVSQPVGRAQAC